MIVFGIFLIAMSILGYRMGKGDALKIELPAKMKSAVRSEAQEAEIEKKLKRI